MDTRRFLDAQADPASGYAAALRELRAGAKRGHWIWYIFPQLEGLGRSPDARHYALANLTDAVMYLQDPVLGPRLAEASSAVLEQLRSGFSLEALMNSTIDVVKLVSSMTLFSAAAARTGGNPSMPTATQVRKAANAILDAAREQGFPPCDFTLRQIRQG